MIENLLILIIKELGPTGLLVVGLYYILYRPLHSIMHSLSVINYEVGEIAKILKEIDRVRYRK